MTLPRTLSLGSRASHTPSLDSSHAGLPLAHRRAENAPRPRSSCCCFCLECLSGFHSKSTPSEPAPTILTLGSCNTSQQAGQQLSLIVGQTRCLRSRYQQICVLRVFLYPHWLRRERKAGSWGCSYKVTNLMGRAASSCPNHLRKLHLLTASPWGLGFQHLNVEGTRFVHQTLSTIPRQFSFS